MDDTIDLRGAHLNIRALHLMANILLDDPLMDEMIRGDYDDMHSEEALILSLLCVDAESNNEQDSSEYSEMDKFPSPEPPMGKLSLQQSSSSSQSSKKKYSTKAAVLVSPLHMPLNDFKNNFRVSLSSFEKLLGLTRENPFMISNERMGSYSQLTIETYWLVWLWYLGNSENMKTVAKRFQLTESGAHMCIRQMAEWTRNKLGKDHITWPYQDRRIQNLKSFEQKFGMPYVLGVLDTTLIPSHILKDCDRVTGRGSHALQAVVGPNLCFLDIYCVLAGGKSCMEILSETRLYKETGILVEDSVILAGPQYPLLQWLITPFSDVARVLDRREKNFNQIHQKIMGVSNTAFKILFETFRRLDNLDSLSSRERASVVSSCCALHNFLLLNGDCEYDTSQTTSEIYSFPLTPDPLVEDSGEGVRIRTNLLDIFTQLRKD